MMKQVTALLLALCQVASADSSQCDSGNAKCGDGQVCVFVNQSYSHCQPLQPLQIPEHRLNVAAAPTKNPLDGKEFYVQKGYQEEIDSSIEKEKDEGTLKNLKQMRDMGSAIWMDTKDHIQRAAEALEEASKASPPPVVTLIVYNLPNRDCDAKASNGEICCEGGSGNSTCKYEGSDCSAGLTEYKTNYIDKIAELFAQYKSVPIVAIIEPDSLPNLATNTGNPRCSSGATTESYKKGIPYAISKIAESCTSCTLYLDIAHGGWLGWENNMDKYKKLLVEIEVDFTKIRGFATNVANYQPLGDELCPSFDHCVGGKNTDHPCCADPCKLASQYNYGHNELNYVQFVASKFKDLLEPKFLVDTGRNGAPEKRQSCSNWCNVRGAGAGRRPGSQTDLPAFLDGYMWLKTPGESDGCTQELPSGQQCPRFDSMCASPDSVGSKPDEPKAPEAGNWFDFTARQLAKNAAFESKNSTNGTTPKPTTTPSTSVPAGNTTKVPSTGSPTPTSTPSTSAPGGNTTKTPSTGSPTPTPSKTSTPPTTTPSTTSPGTVGPSSSPSPTKVTTPAPTTQNPSNDKTQNIKTKSPSKGCNRIRM